MSISREYTAKTSEEAVAAGLEELGLSISEVDVVVLEEGSKGLFGLFGSRPAKVRLTVKEDDADDPLADIFADSKPKAKPAPKAEPRPEKKPEPKPEAKPEKKPEPKPEPKPAPKAEAEAAPEAGDKPEAKRPQPVQRKPKQPRAPKAEKPEKPEEPKQLPPKKIVAEPMRKPEVTEIPADQLDAESPAGQAKAFLTELTGLMGVPVEIAMGTDEEGNVYATMNGDPQGILIGRRGETLDAIQYLTSLRVNRGQENYTRVTLDTENYRAKREDTLIRLANRMANRAVHTGRKVSLEPMNPYERRIIHSALQPNEAVDTHSEGEEPNRRVVITLRK